MEFDRDPARPAGVRLLAQQAQLAFEGLQKLDQSGSDPQQQAAIMEALSRASALHAAELAREACAETGFGNERDKTRRTASPPSACSGPSGPARPPGILGSR